jgi:hypothetical protein
LHVELDVQGGSLIEVVLAGKESVPFAGIWPSRAGADAGIVVGGPMSQAALPTPFEYVNPPWASTVPVQGVLPEQMIVAPPPDPEHVVEAEKVSVPLHDPA